MFLHILYKFAFEFHTWCPSTLRISPKMSLTKLKEMANNGGVVFFLQIVAVGTNVRDLLRSYFSTIRFKWGKTYY